MSGSLLQFPYPTAPTGATRIPVAPGLWWLRMPLPLALDHINIYLLDDGDGWVLIDTGMNVPATHKLWEDIIVQCLDGKPIKIVIATHMHPDHVGMAGWLTDRFHAPLWMSQAEYYQARTFSTMPVELAWTTLQFFRRNGLGEDYIDYLAQHMPNFGRTVYRMPGAYVRLIEGQTLEIGGNRWRVITGSGHSPEHVCLYNEERRLLISGDQVIARITSNVSVMASEPEANPLPHWLDSLNRLFQLPADTLVMPSHHLPFIGLHERLRELIDHHDDHLNDLLDACETPKTVIDLLPVLFRRPIDFGLMSMAVGEALAHLHCLISRSRIERELCDDGIYRYRSIALRWDKARERRRLDDEPMMV